MQKKQLIFTILFDVLFALGVIFTTLISIFILDILNGPFILLILDIVFLTALVIARVVLYKKKIYFRIIPFGVYLISFVLLTIFAHPITTKISIADYKDPTPTEVINIRDGSIRGLYNKDKSVKMYAGIPYAKPPLNELRFKAPVNPDKWEGVKDCYYFGPKSMQSVSSPVMDSVLDMYSEKGWHPSFDTKYVQEVSEDSLYLNVWAPSNAENLPVFVFIHGGSLSTGSSAYEDYNGETFAKNGVVMVTITYRLNVFGYFAHESLLQNDGTTGNYGLLDQIKALEWVKENISYFGGDPSNVTVGGESAGSSSVSALCISPLASGLFKRAIGESSSIVMNKPPHTFRSLEDAFKEGNKTLEEFKCKTVDDLRKIPADKLLKTVGHNQEMTNDGYCFRSDMSPKEIYQNKLNNEEALLNGYNVKEADAFYMPEFLLSPTNKKNIEERIASKTNKEVSKQIMEIYKDEINKNAFNAANEIMSVMWFIAPHHVWSNTALEADIPVYRYQFTKENGYYTTYHSGEMIYAYGNIARKNKPYAYNEADYNLSEKMVKYWTNFIKCGNPNGEDLPLWEEYNPNNSKPIMELGNNVSMFEDKYLKLYEVIKGYYEEI